MSLGAAASLGVMTRGDGRPSLRAVAPPASSMRLRCAMCDHTDKDPDVVPARSVVSSPRAHSYTKYLAARTQGLHKGVYVPTSGMLGGKGCWIHNEAGSWKVAVVQCEGSVRIAATAISTAAVAAFVCVVVITIGVGVAVIFSIERDGCIIHTTGATPCNSTLVERKHPSPLRQHERTSHNA